MSKDANRGPVGGFKDIGEGISIFNNCPQEFMGQVRMRPTVAGALEEGEMFVLFHVVDAFGREPADGLGEQCA